MAKRPVPPPQYHPSTGPGLMAQDRHFSPSPPLPPLEAAQIRRLDAETESLRDYQQRLRRAALELARLVLVSRQNVGIPMKSAARELLRVCNERGHL